MRPPARLLQVLRTRAAGVAAGLTFDGAALSFAGAPVTFISA